VQHKLIDLYVSPHMSSSVKLHIISALDQTTRLKDGLDWLLGRHHLQVAAAASSTSAITDALTSSAAAEQAVKSERATNEALKKCSVGQATPLTGYQRIIDIMLTKQVCAAPI
jgi:hypothetical protein